MSLRDISTTDHDEYEHRASFTSDVVPTERPFGNVITNNSITAEAIFDYWEATNCPNIKSIPVDRDSGEPGPIIKYDLLTKLLDRPKNRLSEEVKGVFRALKHARSRYFAGYEIYFAEQRSRNDLYAERSKLIAKGHEIQFNPERFGENALRANTLEKERNYRECMETVARYRMYGGGLARCAHEFVTAKIATVPHINKLIADHNQAARRFIAKKAQAMNGHAAKHPDGNGSSQRQAEKMPAQTDPEAGFSGPKQQLKASKLNASTPQVAGMKRRREEETVSSERKGEGKDKEYVRV